MKKLTISSLRKNKKRTVVTIIGVILSTALITAVACMATSFRASIIAYEKLQNGDYHYLFIGVPADHIKYFMNHQSFEKVSCQSDLGYALLEGSKNEDKPYLYVKKMSQDAMDAMAIKLVSGRLPQNEEELLISRHILGNGGVDIRIGQKLLLPIGVRQASDGYELSQWNPYSYESETFVPLQKKEYTVVGIMERPGYDVEDYIAPGYTVITYGDSFASDQKVNIFVTYTKEALRNRNQVTAALFGVTEDVVSRYEHGGDLTDEENNQIWQLADDYECNGALIKWELLDFSNETMNLLYMMCGLAIMVILVASVFCIRNSFVISLTEKMRLYGMISSIGATKKQRKQMVYMEAGDLGMIGIPVGILSGLLATYLVISFTTSLLKKGLGMELIFSVSVWPVILAALISVVTIFLSSLKSARMAGKLSPICAIHSNDTEDTLHFAKRLSEKQRADRMRKSYRVPKLIQRLFGVGGNIAYKNLKRSRVKYRTTVISIVVSVAVFIGLSTFTNLAFYLSGYYYENKGYNLHVSLLGSEHEENKVLANRLAQLDTVKYIEIRRMIDYNVYREDLPFRQKYLSDLGSVNTGSGRDHCSIPIFSIGQDAWQSYCKNVGVSASDVKDQAILIADYNETIILENGKRRHVSGMMYDYRPGDTIQGFAYSNDQESALDVTVAVMTDQRPLCLRDYAGHGFLIVSDEWMDDHLEYADKSMSVRIECEDAYALETEIAGLLDSQGYDYYNIYNLQREYENERSLYLLIDIFLYGFVCVIALIGITNIFNTVMTNMELRAREFAMLKSIGMTGRELKRMVFLESVFYGEKSLAFAIPLGCVISYAFYRLLSDQFETAYRLPLGAIALSVASVVLLLFVIMNDSMHKINRKNLIETIQNENI